MDDLFCLEEYRGQGVEDLAVKARSPNARSLILDTQFDATSAANIANAYLLATRNPAQTYSFVVSATLSLTDIVGAIKRLSVSYGSIYGYVAKIASFRTNWTTGLTTVTVRGN